MIITLIGYRGTGKSTVGRVLAEQLGWPFQDVDPEIENRAGRSIADIFAQQGEPHFRDLEEQVLRDQLSVDPSVVVTGGGTLLRETNRQAVAAAGITVWLQAKIETIAQRITGDPLSGARRPSLTGADPVSEIASVLAIREPIYAAAATYKVSTDGKEVETIVSEILSRIAADINVPPSDSPRSGDS